MITLPTLFNPAIRHSEPLRPLYMAPVMDRQGLQTSIRRSITGSGLVSVAGGLQGLNDFTEFLTQAGGVVDVIASAAQKIKPQVSVDVQLPWSKIALGGAAAAALVFVFLRSGGRRR